MPERWERELRKLRREEMPEGVRARADEGPRAEPMPPPRQRVVAAGVAIAVFLAAGAFAFQALRPISGGRLAGDPSEPTFTDATVTFLASDFENPDLPFAEMTANGVTVRGQFDSLSWRNADIDTDRPTYVDPLSIPLGSRVVIAGDADAVAGTFADPFTRDPIQDLPLTDLDGYVMAEPGEYFLVFEAKWAPDVVPFYFPIKLRPVEPDLRDADAELSITAYPFEAALSYGGQRIAVAEMRGTWKSDGKATATGGHALSIPGWARIQIPVGTPLQISGNWEDWRNHLEPGDGRVAPNDQGSLVFPSSTGTYDWRMTATWPQGEAEFAFGVELLDTGVSVQPSPIEEPNAELSDVLQVRCDEHGIDVLTPVVAAQADGVHVDARVSGLADPEINLRSIRLPGIQWWSGSSGVDGEFTRPVPAGTALVHCESGPGQGDGPEPFEAEFEVIDPAGYFVDYALSCNDGGSSVEFPFPFDVQANASLAGSPVEAVESGLQGVLASDTIEAAGYLTEPGGRRFVRLVRDVDVIGWFLVGEHPAVGFHIMVGYVCADSGLTPGEV